MARSGTTAVSSATAYKAAAAAKEGSMNEVTTIYDFWRQKGAIPMDDRGNTMLHILCMHGNAWALKKLVDNGLLKREDVRKSNKIGDTPLHIAAMFGHDNVANILVDLDLDLDLVSARNDFGETPLYIAAASIWGNEVVFNLLTAKASPHASTSSSTSTEVQILLTRKDGSTVVHAAIMQENYRLAISILQSFPELAERHDENGATPLDILATKPMSFYSGSSYCLENLGSWPFIPIQILAILTYHYCIPSTDLSMDCKSKCAHDVEDPPQNRVIFKSRWPLATKLLAKCGWFREIDCSKKSHEFALVLAKCLVAKKKDWNDFSTYSKTMDSSACTTDSNVVSATERIYSDDFYNKRNRMKKPLIEATRNGISELVMEILEEFPYAASGIDEKNGKNILHIAVEQKDRHLYDYFIKKTFAIKDMLTRVDSNGNNVLHLAANLGSGSRVHLRNLNQMTWDVCWFKRVMYDAPPSSLQAVNFEGKTATQVFKENHSNLVKKSETELKEMNNGLMLISAIIGTVSYASLFTVPGGFGQDKGDKAYGLPVLLESEDKKTVLNLKFYMWYNVFTLFYSVMALAIMLSILLSRFRSRDFYMALPFRFLAALSALFCSLVFSSLGYFQAYILEKIPFHPKPILYVSFTALALFYFDTMFLIVKYMCITLRYSSFFDGKGQEVLDLLG